MILVDANQVMLASIMVDIDKIQNNIEIDLIRHIFLNSIRHNRMKHKHKYGEMILCWDGKNSWRRSIFPHYKANRRKDLSDDSGLNWKQIYDCLNTIREEMKEEMPYINLQVEGAEGDDVIAVLCHKYGTELNSGDKILILSGDKDFIQLQSYGNVFQYNPIKNEPVSVIDPALYKYELILRGDTGDGVPNFLSDDDTFINKEKRQKPILKKKLDGWLLQKPEEFCDENMLRNYHRNRKLIDLWAIPENIKNDILNQYDNAKPNSRSNIMNYFMKMRLKNLMESIGDF